MKPSLFKDICGTFATGVTIITSRKLNKDYGFTANSFTSVSIDPLLILFCLDKKAKSNESLNKNDFFVINILSKSQEKTCFQFANPELNPEQRFKKINTKKSENGIKIISGCCSFLECKVTKIIDGGDHYIFLGECISGNIDETKEPLIYHKGNIL